MEKSRAIEVLKPLVNSFVDYANITMKEEDDDIAEALEMAVEALAQPEYEEVTPEKAASEIASGSIMSAWSWLNVIIQLKQMGYAICRKR